MGVCRFEVRLTCFVSVWYSSSLSLWLLAIMAQFFQIRKSVKFSQPKLSLDIWSCAETINKNQILRGSTFPGRLFAYKTVRIDSAWCFFPPQKHQRLYPSLFGTEVSRPKSATTTREFSPAILGVWRPLNQPHFPKQHPDLHSNKTATACIGGAAAAEGTAGIPDWGFSMNQLGEAVHRWEFCRWFRWQMALHRPVFASWWERYRTPTMRCAQKRRKRWWMQLKEQPLVGFPWDSPVGLGFLFEEIWLAELGISWMSWRS